MKSVGDLPYLGLEPVVDRLKSVTRGQCDARPTVTFPVAEHRCPTTGTKLNCLVTEAQNIGDPHSEKKHFLVPAVTNQRNVKQKGNKGQGSAPHFIIRAPYNHICTKQGHTFVNPPSAAYQQVS